MKHLGQHFLISSKIAERIAQEAGIMSEDTILEIGPGKGALTDALLTKQPRKIVAVEKDKGLVLYLKRKYEGEKRIKIFEKDVRNVFRDPLFNKTIGGRYKVVANIPYYLTSYLFRLLLEHIPIKPVSMTLMVQKEVAERITAKPPHMNLLAISVQSMGKVKTAFRVSKTYFTPQPKIDSAVIIINDITDDFFKNIDKKKFFTLLHYGFGNKRKVLVNNVARGLHQNQNELKTKFKTCGVNERARAENLSLEQWKCLFTRIRKSL